MANFPRVCPAGWALNDPVTSAQQNQLDIDHAASINGDGGGTWHPTAIINVGGLGLRLHETVGAAANLQLNTRDVWRHQDMLGDTESGNWTVRPYNVRRNTGNGGTQYLTLNRLLHGARLTEVRLRWCGAGGHAAFPGGAPVMPYFDLYRVSQDGVAGLIGTGTDASATAGIYEAPHDIVLTGLAEDLDLTLYRYQMIVTGETGGNFVANAEALALRSLLRCSSYAEY